MYSLDTPIIAVTGIGEKIALQLQKNQILTVLDLLLWLPLRYEDRSTHLTIDQLQVDQLATFTAQVVTSSNYYKGRRSIQSATVKDETGKIKLMWFNNKWIIDRLKKDELMLFSGKKNDRGVIVQPVVETLSENTIHTDRLVPIYSQLAGFKQGSLRRILKNIIDQLAEADDLITKLDPTALNFLNALKTLHFPDQSDHVIAARERLALEEMLQLIKRSHQIKQEWEEKNKSYQLTISDPNFIPSSIPFKLTSAQQKAMAEILLDLTKSSSMNRLLIGDVGSGKTVVAGIACYHTINNGFNAALIAPTQILAQQHLITFKNLFPNLPIQLLTAKSKLTTPEVNDQPTLYIGTHSVINKLIQIKPALVIFDEQHRFGVSQRAATLDLEIQPHTLTMSATPIPRSLMLTIFSHLKLSVIDQMPEGRIPPQTWIVPAAKRQESYQWLSQQLQGNQTQTAILVCPFINKSKNEEFAHIPSASERFDQLKAFFAKQQPHLRIALLHGKMKKKDKNQISQQLFAQQIDLLITTPVVEVGIDVPTASIIIIEAGERFGMASLHQLRGRVGRAGQSSYCLVFTSKESGQENARLKEFSQNHDGLKLAELDLQRRGAGDLFGLRQHGLDNLRFTDWTNLSLISQARKIYDQLETEANWQSFLPIQETSSSPVAN